MTKFSTSTYWFMTTIVIGIAVFLAYFLIPQIVHPDSLRTVDAVLFEQENGASVITRDMAHIRIPYDGITTSKTLELSTEYKSEQPIEVGIRRGIFWLDYERVPLSPVVSFDVTNAFRHPDGSLDIMYFVQYQTQEEYEKPSVLIGPVQARIIPSVPSAKTLLQTVRTRIRSLIIRQTP